MTTDRLQLVRDSYTAYETGDRDLIERVIADDFVFSAPPDVGIDRATYFERCWPNAGHVATFDYVRLRETGGEVLVTYEAPAPTARASATPSCSGSPATGSRASRCTSAGTSSDEPHLHVNVKLYDGGR